MAGAVVSVSLYHWVLFSPGVSMSPGDIVTMASAVVNNISGAVTNIEFPYL